MELSKLSTFMSSWTRCETKERWDEKAMLTMTASDGAQSAGKGSPAFEQRAKLLAMCGWDTRLMAAPKSAELRPWDRGKGQAANSHRAVLFCSACGAQTGLWAFLPGGGLTLSASPPSKLAAGPAGVQQPASGHCKNGWCNDHLWALQEWLVQQTAMGTASMAGAITCLWALQEWLVQRTASWGSSRSCVGRHSNLLLTS